jgi:CHAT domain-containing protein
MADPGDDGLLTATEIADLELRARFVALSACNTANFDLAEMSRDLPALASAFAVAGAPATLGTLWPVNSETGKAVVAGAFTRLQGARGVPAATALAEAQRAFLAAPPGRPYLHPRFWAPFVVLGDGGSR